MAIEGFPVHQEVLTSPLCIGRVFPMHRIKACERAPEVRQVKPAVGVVVW